jgi:hypothetical protein
MKEMKRAEKTLALLKRGRGVNDFMGTRPLPGEVNVNIIDALLKTNVEARRKLLLLMSIDLLQVQH